MKQSDFWRLFLIVALTAGSLLLLYPPSDRNLLDEFRQRAQNVDTNFTAIVQKAEQLGKEYPGRTFDNLLTAIGTNDIARYFPKALNDRKVKKRVEEGMAPARPILFYLQEKGAGQIKLGLDLQGGISFLVRMETNKLANVADKSRALDQAVEVLRKRVDMFGVAEPVIQREGEDRILIQLPGLSEARKAEAKDTIEKAAYLEFRMVHPDNDELMPQGLVPAGYELMKEPKHRNRQGVELSPTYLVRKKPERGLTGRYVKEARVVPNAVTGVPEIDFTMNSEGGSIFADITREYSPKGSKYYQLGIVLDGQLISAPQIHGEIPAGRGQITGTFTWEEAFSLANSLQNPLEAPVKIIKEDSVDPSLGKDSIRSGMTAAIIGTVAVVAFMLVYYMFAGLVANIALVLNIVILFGVMAFFDTTLTLPGIAGIVLTIGMAVDANVLIYERIREELAAGKSMRGALAAGYEKAFGTIFDSNLTTMIASVICIVLGTGSVKGFGVTLTIGLIVNMITALIATRLIFDWMLEKGWLKTLRMLHLIRGSNIDFMKYAKLAFAISWSIIIIGCSYGVFVRGHRVFGVDFAGGDSLTLQFDQKQAKVDPDKLREAVMKAVGADPVIQYQRNLATGLDTLRVTTVNEKGDTAAAALQSAFPNAGFNVIGKEATGAIVGSEIMQAAILSVIIALFGIMIYVAFRYEFAFGVGAVLSLIHDVGMTLGVFFLFGRQLNAPMVAAILTIIGFSINDTIVIFDRIREDLKLGVRGTFREVMNKALNQTLSRTLITSGTVFLATMALYLFGGGVINDFAFTFLVGIVTGTYSSIYIASALVLWWYKGQRPMSAAPQAQVEKAAPARV
jgi:SecD/SecF fusion protein